MKPLIKARYLNNKKNEYCSMNSIKKQNVIMCETGAAKNLNNSSSNSLFELG